MISQLSLHEPSVHLIRTSKGLLGHHTLLKHPPTPATAPAGSPIAPAIPAQPPRRSEVFELRLVDLSEGRIIYEDRTQPGLVPMVWQHVGIALHTDPGRNPTYDFQLMLHGGSAGSARAQGRFHIDNLSLMLNKFVASLTIDPDQPRSPAPPEVQQFLKQYEIRGSLAIEGSAEIPGAGSVEPSRFAARLRLSDGRYRPVPGWPAIQDASMAFEVASATPPATGFAVRISAASGRMGGTRMQSGSAALLLDPQSTRWELKDLRTSLAFAMPVKSEVTLALDGNGTALPKPEWQLNLRADSPIITLPWLELPLTEASLDAALTSDRIELIDDGDSRHGVGNPKPDMVDGQVFSVEVSAPGGQRARR